MQIVLTLTILDNYNSMINVEETSYRIDGDAGMLNRLVSMICVIPLPSISDTLWSQRPPAERAMYRPASSRSNSFGEDSDGDSNTQRMCTRR